MKQNETIGKFSLKLSSQDNNSSSYKETEQHGRLKQYCSSSQNWDQSNTCINVWRQHVSTFGPGGKISNLMLTPDLSLLRSRPKVYPQLNRHAMKIFANISIICWYSVTLLHSASIMVVTLKRKNRDTCLAEASHATQQPSSPSSYYECRSDIQTKSRKIWEKLPKCFLT